MVHVVVPAGAVQVPPTVVPRRAVATYDVGVGPLVGSTHVTVAVSLPPEGPAQAAVTPVGGFGSTGLILRFHTSPLV